MNEALKALMRDIEHLGWKYAASDSYGGDFTITVETNEIAAEDTGGRFTSDRNKTKLVRNFHFGQAEGGY